MKPPKFYIQIGRQFWLEPDLVNDKPGAWVSKKNASEVPLNRARIYLKDWSKYGVKALLVS